MKHITLVTSDADWQALYVDGKSVTQDHRVDTYEALQVVAELGEPITFEQVYADADHPSNEGYYPDDLKEVVRA